MCMNKDKQRRRVFLGLAFYSRETHKGVARYAHEAGWILDATMANYPIVPDRWNGDGMIVLLEPKLPHLTEMVKTSTIPVISLMDRIASSFPGIT